LKLAEIVVNEFKSNAPTATEQKTSVEKSAGFQKQLAK